MADHKTIFKDVIAAILLFLFLYTALSKLLDWTAFHAVLKQSPLIGEKAGVIAVMVPLVEIALAVLLFFPFLRKSGIAGSLFLLSAFTLYILYMMIFSPELPCSCGGIISTLGWKGHLLLNTGLIILSALALRKDKRRPMQLVKA